MTAEHEPVKGPAWGVGIETVSADGRVLDTWFPQPIVGDTEGALRLKEAHGHPGGAGTHRLHRAEALDALRVDLDRLTGTDRIRGVDRTVVATFIADLSTPPIDAHDAHLRLHLLSHRLVQPATIDLTGLDTILTESVWTDHGPCSVDDFDRTRLRMLASGRRLDVLAIGRIPRLVDHHVPSGVGIVDTSRVLLGAHLAPGTTIGPGGFCGPDSGTLGPSHIDGQLAAGVVIGAGSIIGAGSSLGISLGHRCRIGPGVHLHADTVVHHQEGGSGFAADYQGRDDVTFTVSAGAVAVCATANTIQPQSVP